MNLHGATDLRSYLHCTVYNRVVEYDVKCAAWR